MFSNLWFQIFLFLLLGEIEPHPLLRPKRQVVIVSFDGFRYDYHNHYKLEAFQQMASRGVHAPKGIISAFTTKTFPNHYSIITGLYEETHGVIDNHMYDPILKATFHQKDTDPRWWNGGEPVWLTAKHQNKKTAAIFWAGSNIKVRGEYPDYYLKYNRSITYETRVTKAVQWLKEEHVDFLALYFQDPDKTGHKYGIFTQQMNRTLQEVNRLLRSFIDQLEEAQLLENIDLLVVSDHGMVNTSAIPQNDSLVLYLDQMLDLKDVQLIPQVGPISGIIPLPGREDAVYRSLSKHQQHMKVYKKKDIPNRWRYKNHHRITPILAVADEEYIIATNKSELPIHDIGQHGYDNNLLNMRGIFFAQGPSFKSNFQIEPFENINIYALICHLLDIKPSPNNGTVSVFRTILKTPLINHSSGFY